MADEADRGNDNAEFFLDVSLKNVGRPLQIAGIGMCLNCGDAVDGERRWCDADCRADYEDEQRRKAARTVQAAALAA